VLKPAHFYEGRHQRIFDAALALRDARKVIDIVSVMTQLRDAGHILQVEVGYLTQLLGAAGVHPPHYLRQLSDVVIERAGRRDARALGGQLELAAERDGTSLEKIIEQTRATLDKIELGITSTSDDKRASVVLAETMASIRAGDEQGKSAGLSTGFVSLDRVTGGIHKELIVCAARPGMGKTSFATQLSTHFASQGIGVYYVALENKYDLMKRAIALKASVPVPRLDERRLTPEEWSRVTAAAEEIHRYPWWLDDTPGPTARQVGAKARRVQLQLARTGKKLGLIVVDYVQLLRGSDPKMESHHKIAENARTLRAIAGDLQVGVLALSQLNRGVDKRPNKRPMVSDLAGSGELETAGQSVWMLFREDLYRRRGQPDGEAELVIEKQNSGPRGVTVRLLFDAPTFRFSNAPEDEPSENGAPSAQRSFVVQSPAAASAPRDEDEPHAFADLLDGRKEMEST
jgi:replicative DNA helicase